MCGWTSLDSLWDMLGIKPGAEVPKARPCWWKWHMKWPLTDRCSRGGTGEESWSRLKHSRAPAVPSLGICLMTVRSSLGPWQCHCAHKHCSRGLRVVGKLHPVSIQDRRQRSISADMEGRRRGISYLWQLGQSRGRERGKERSSSGSMYSAQLPCAYQLLKTEAQGR